MVCERTIRSRDQHATSNRSAVSTKPDYIDSDCNAQRCAICLETFEIGESVSWAKNTMYCNHAFHTSCIKHWLHRKRTCPVCRYGIILRQDQYVRCNIWSDWCCGRRPRVLYYKHHRLLMTQCRESGQYCIGHGLVFPYESPRLAIPYEPRIREMKRMLAIVKATKVFKSKEHAAKVKKNSKHEMKKRRRGEIIIKKVNSSYDDEVLNQLSGETDKKIEENTVADSTTVHIANDIESIGVQGQNDPVEESFLSSVQPIARNDDSISSTEFHSTRLRSRSMLRHDENGEDEPRIVALFEDEGDNDELLVHTGRREFRIPRLRSGVMSEVMDRRTSEDNIRVDDNTV